MNRRKALLGLLGLAVTPKALATPAQADDLVRADELMRQVSEIIRRSRPAFERICREFSSKLEAERAVEHVVYMQGSSIGKTLRIPKLFPDEELYICAPGSRWARESPKMGLARGNAFRARIAQI